MDEPPRRRDGVDERGSGVGVEGSADWRRVVGMAGWRRRRGGDGSEVDWRVVCWSVEGREI